MYSPQDDAIPFVRGERLLLETQHIVKRSSSDFDVRIDACDDACSAQCRFGITDSELTQVVNVVSEPKRITARDVVVKLWDSRENACVPTQLHTFLSEPSRYALEDVLLPPMDPGSVEIAFAVAFLPLTSIRPISLDVHQYLRLRDGCGITLSGGAAGETELRRATVGFNELGRCMSTRQLNVTGEYSWPSSLSARQQCALRRLGSCQHHDQCIGIYLPCKPIDDVVRDRRYWEVDDVFHMEDVNTVNTAMGRFSARFEASCQVMVQKVCVSRGVPSADDVRRCLAWLESVSSDQWNGEQHTVPCLNVHRNTGTPNSR